MSIPRVALGPPQRRLSQPRSIGSGFRWVRRTERWVSQWLSETVLPRTPGTRWLYSRILERQLQLFEGEIELRGLGQSWDGTRVLLLGDFHVGPFVSRDSLARAIDRLLESAQPDLLLISGDFVTSGPEEMHRFRSAFESLRAPLGTFAVLGNHDYYGAGPGDLPEQIADLDICLLRNDSRRLTREGCPLLIAGTEDPIEGEADFESALSERRTGETCICLTHHPDAALEAEKQGVDLLLSGHTHGGQICLPNRTILWPMSRYGYDVGLYRDHHTQVVVTRGLGAVGVPVRLFCPPDGVQLTLRAV